MVSGFLEKLSDAALIDRQVRGWRPRSLAYSVETILMPTECGFALVDEGTHRLLVIGRPCGPTIFSAS
jgi:hypothetical protein